MVLPAPCHYPSPAWGPSPAHPLPQAPPGPLPSPGIDPGVVPAGFHERKGKPYCRQDFIALFAPKCQGCERPLTDNYLSALQGVWHPECFVCAVSGVGLG